LLGTDRFAARPRTCGVGGNKANEANGRCRCKAESMCDGPQAQPPLVTARKRLTCNRKQEGFCITQHPLFTQIPILYSGRQSVFDLQPASHSCQGARTHFPAMAALPLKHLLNHDDDGVAEPVHRQILGWSGDAFSEEYVDFSAAAQLLHR
jgi:hypothetical protein